MARPSKHPMPEENVQVTTAQGPKATASESHPMSLQDYEFLAKLDPQVTGDDRVRSDMIALLTDDETIEALATWAATLAVLGLHAAPSTATTQKLKRLQRLRRRIELSQALVTRHMQATGAPLQDFVSELHRIVDATPEHSPLRVGFSLFLERWQNTFRGPGRPAKAATPAPPTPDAPK